ncbi:hypothetical protein [Conexibacter woesei]|uniref:Uncharacterized protein n=1 Tax=Conexibacter woesei (strain DSM 14684 / CCUG 47730 / CIP 108061 / JCM 11494 / NBRC 100937 / ID131577) TaxID=469383 RepID=D3EZL9_CONWI|nr:hypothetical protein [Conexibacter woesei]ADB53857.1 hypothetical protein Cwoe_5452 [Conexibacter woesei DSM 14684]
MTDRARTHSRTLRARAGTVLAVAAAALLCGGAATAGAAERWPPGGTADGVRIAQRGGQSAIVFEQRASRLYRTIAGKRVTVVCVEKARSRSFMVTESSASTELVAPKTRQPQRISGLARGADYCRVWLPKRTVRRSGSRGTIGPRPVVAIATTERGTVHLDEEATAMTMDLVITVAGSIADDGGFASSARVVRFFDRAGRAAPIEVVALASPADTPPAGKVGYYRGGREHAAAVMLSTSDRRLFMELLPDDELRTNVLGYINGYGSEIE